MKKVYLIIMCMMTPEIKSMDGTDQCRSGNQAGPHKYTEGAPLGYTRVRIRERRGNPELGGLPRLSLRVNITDLPHGNTPLHCAVKEQCLYKVYSCIEKGADRAAQNKRGVTPLHIAVLYYKEKESDEPVSKVILQTVLCEGNLDSQDDEGDTALHLAILCCVKGAVGMLTKAGARSDIKNNRGQTAYSLAQSEGIPLLTRVSGF